jgi:glycosyltransferase involved in cell wall biosynthesis
MNLNSDSAAHEARNGRHRVLSLIKGLGKGGAEGLLVNIVREADRSRFHHEVAYLLPFKDAFVGELRDASIPVHCLDGARGAGWILGLRNLVARRGIDLVHVHSPYAAIGARIGLARSCPIVYTEHNVWDRYHRATYWANLLSYPRNDHVFTVSEHVRMSIRYPGPLRLLPKPPLETLYHGPDARAIADVTADGVREELGIPQAVPVIGTVANLKGHKGHEHLLRAAVQVRHLVPEVRFVLVGQGPREPYLRRLAHSLGLDGAVIFAGYREDALRIAASFDLFVLSSLHEGLSIALVEAMALEKAAVVTEVGGLPEVVKHNVNGLVVAPADPAALAESILTLLRDDRRREVMAKAARRRAAEFDIRTSVRRMEEVYEELLG